MKAPLFSLSLAPVLLAAGLAIAAAPGVVRDGGTCTQALADAREAAAAAQVGPKARTAGEELIVLAESRCADQNFTAADELLAIARGIFAEE